jgi:hypothetical protein
MIQQQDPTISRIREVRHLISERFGHDPKKIVAYYLKLQEEHERERAKSTEERDQRNAGQGPTTS